MTNQREPNLLPLIHEYGCYWLSCGYLAQATAGSLLGATAVQCNEMYHKMIDLGYINENCLVLNPTGVFRTWGGNGYFLTSDYDKDLPWRFNPNYQPLPNQREILEWHNDDTGFTHFVVGNGDPMKSGKDRVEWDSLGLSNTVKNGYIKGKRIIQLA